jgi:DNA replication protein DnaC
MRTEETWKQVFQQHLTQYTSRIQEDISRYYKESDEIIPLTNTFLYGPVGSGKTIEAILLAIGEKKNRYFRNQTCSISFESISELFYFFKQSFGKNEEENEKVENLSNTDILILDDIGVEKTSDWALSVLYLIINRRYENKKLTLITSNFSLEELATKLGDDRITSRISRMCKIVKLEKSYTND